MAKKQQSFADKASKQSKKELTYAKYVKSIPPEKKGFWRFNETTIAVNKGENLDAKKFILKPAKKAIVIGNSDREHGPRLVSRPPTKTIKKQLKSPQTAVKAAKHHRKTSQNIR